MNIEALIALAVVLSDSALSERDPAGAAAGRGSRIGRHNFSIHPLSKSEYALRCGGSQNRRRAGARLREKAQGQGKILKFLFGIAVTH